tara:strand:+ start:4802 stop:10123 length:5322 start_codon:yes stop_codon:yes gene_type:complete
MEQSASLRLGEHITQSILKPWRLPFLPITFPLLGFKICLEHFGFVQPPESRVEWVREAEGKGILVYVDGYTSKHVESVRQDLEDIASLRNDIAITIVCTSKFQQIFVNIKSPVFILPDKINISGNQIEDWGVLLEEQIGGICSFFHPSMVLVIGPYPHRALKNVVRANPDIRLVHDQRPSAKSQKKFQNQIFTHLSGVLRSRKDRRPAPDSLFVHRVDELGMTSWLSNVFESLEPISDNSFKFIVEQSKNLIEVTRAAERDTSKISNIIDEINQQHGIEKTYSLVTYTLINLELQDETNGKKYTRDLFVAAIRSLGVTNFEHMLELAEWRLHRYQDERAAKSVIQFLRNAERVEEATVYMRYVKDEVWKKREIQTVTTRMLAQYGINSSQNKDFTEMESFEVEAIARAELEHGVFHTLKIELGTSKGGLKRKTQVLHNILKATADIYDRLFHELYLEYGFFKHESAYLAKRLNAVFLLYDDAPSAMKALEHGPLEKLESEVAKTQTILSKINRTWLKSIGPLSSISSLKPKKNQILYLAHMALPFESAGYCTRTHGLLTNLSQINPNIAIQTRLGYPLDKGKLKHLTDADVKETFKIDGMKYNYHTSLDEGIRDADERAYIERASMALIEQARSVRPTLIQAASNHVNGAIGLRTARALNLPFIYEVRGLWHMSRVARQPHFIHHAEYKAMDEAEIAVCFEADMVLAITHAVRYYLIERGVDAERILVLPNGVDTQRFVPIKQDQDLRKELQIGEGTVIGYVGSFVKYEGLDLLIEAFAKLSANRSDVYLLLVGDGQIRNDLESLVDELDLRNQVKFTGRVPHDDVNRYHSIIDIAPFPRTPDIVCEFISPLKPFESMAMGQVVVGSNVAALREIIVDGEHGRLFNKGDSHHLVEVLESIVDNPKEMARLKASGLAWVKEYRDWKFLASYLNEAHKTVLNNAPMPKLLGSGQPLTIINGKVSTVIEGKPTILAIMDEFSSTALSADAHLIQPTPENWQKLLDQHPIDMLIVESAWVGNNGSWHRKVGWYNEEEITDLETLVETCRERNIPSVFYNKEDPVHFNRFSKTSTLFDHVFTTDVGCLPQYEALENSLIQSVDWIQFAAQPDVHHPYNQKLEDRKDIAFAGTYYAGKYPERCEKMDMLFDASVGHGLVIYDRQSDGGNPQYVFPERFNEHILGKLEYQDMLKKHRDHLIFLNVNSVEDSPTMAARRIFEIPASGACLVSGPGLAVREVFGNTVPIVTSPQQAHATLNSLMSNRGFLQYTIQASRHIVLKNHLNIHRVQKMLHAASLTLQPLAASDPVLIIEDTSTPLVEICLWIARQEITFKHLVLPSSPSTKAEELLLNLLQHRGLTVSFDQSEAYDSSTIHIYDVLAFDHHGLEALFNEMRSTSKTVHFRSPAEDLLATCRQPSSEEEANMEYFVSQRTPEMNISTITDHTFANVPSTILIAGHDLKFAMPLVEVMKEMGIRVLVDKWDNHNKFDAEISKNLLTQADAVWCEWALGNVEWYSKMIQGDTPLFVRYHLQERNLEYLQSSNQENISHISFVCDYYRKNAISINQISETVKTSVIPNLLEMDSNYVRKNDNYTIGFVGMVPLRKRIDLALDLLEELLYSDDRYSLKVVGKGPDDYKWLLNRPEEKEYYDLISKRLESNPILASKVEFLGFVDDISEFYCSVGHVISTSDFESFHLTLADGPILGATAHTLPWNGAKDIYNDLWLSEDIHSMAKEIHKLNLSNETAYRAHLQSLHLAPQMQKERISLSIIEAMFGGEINE